MRMGKEGNDCKSKVHKGKKEWTPEHKLNGWANGGRATFSK